MHLSYTLSALNKMHNHTSLKVVNFKSKSMYRSYTVPAKQSYYTLLIAVLILKQQIV